MTIEAYSADWGSSTITVSADWSQASCPVEGTDGRQVADFSHHPALALRYALQNAARDDGLSIEDDHVAEMVEEAMDRMTARLVRPGISKSC